MILLLKNLLFTVVLPGSVAVYVPLWICRGNPLVAGPGIAAAAALFTLGAAIYTWTVWDFATFGRGTPAPIDAPKRLVVRGLYRFSRNPMYVGVMTVLAGQLVLFRSGPLAAYTLAVFAGFHTWILMYEEPRLEAAFGSEYDAYRKQVRRWVGRFSGGRTNKGNGPR